MTKAPMQEATDHARDTSEATKIAQVLMCEECLKENVLNGHHPGWLLSTGLACQ